MMWEVQLFTKRAKKDYEIARRSQYQSKVQQIFEDLEQNPFSPLFSFEILRGQFSGAYSKRINQQHRVVYTVDETNKVVRIASCWNHY